jgi:hypothetical protein
VSTSNLRIALGGPLIAAGAVLTVVSYSAHDVWSAQRFWPLLVVAFGAMRAAEQWSRIEGWVLMIVGCAVLLSNLGLFALPEGEAVRYWPLAVIAVAVAELLLPRRRGARGEAVATLFLGAWLQLAYFGAPPIGSYRLWPLVLAAVGCVMVWRGLHSIEREYRRTFEREK